ncbi:hypothetical protein RHCRD62_30277 [Rhodococcus sp. RD6.2]|nr:hypothetical protein RHCRD62_30277 [Rhodococcus sp. RD6.2]
MRRRRSRGRSGLGPWRAPRCDWHHSMVRQCASLSQAPTRVNSQIELHDVPAREEMTYATRCRPSPRDRRRHPDLSGGTAARHVLARTGTRRRTSHPVPVGGQPRGTARDRPRRGHRTHLPMGDRTGSGQRRGLRPGLRRARHADRGRLPAAAGSDEA